MILETVFTLLAVFKPVHVMQTDEVSCGATGRLMKESVKVYAAPRQIMVSGMEWDFLGQDEDGDWVVHYQVEPNAHMSMTLTFNTGGAYLSIQGIDTKRRPCKDMVYLKRIK